MNMFPHQTSGALRIARGVPTYLGLDMGIGKSRTFIEAAKLRNAHHILILCPASAVLVWKREIALWHFDATYVVVKGPGDLQRPATYYLVTHGLMSQKNGAIPEALRSGSRFDMTAIDEAHAFNAADSNRVKALQFTAHKLGQIVPLSGTPMKNHAGDLYTLLAVCWPEGLTAGSRMMQRYEFEDRFCRITHKTFGGSRMIRVIEGSKNLDQLKTIIAPFMMRVRKEDVFKDMPPILWDQVPVPLDMTVAHSPEMQRLIQRARPLLDNPLLDEPLSPERVDAILGELARNTHMMTLRRMIGLAKLRGATEYIVDMLDSLSQNRKVLVFAHHAHVIAALYRHLGEYSPALIVGTTSAKDREVAVDKFLNDPHCRVFIGNIQAAGTAITLVSPTCKCSDVVFVESSWTPMDNAQAACRVHRIGQQDGVVARMLSAAGTIDDLVNGLLVRKAREFTQLFDTRAQENTK